MRVRRTVQLLPLVVLLAGVSAEAQVIGTFRWQTRPACNLITLTVVQQGGMFQLTGSDDLCGAGAAPVTGTAVPAGGGIALGMSVALPSGRAAHLTATITLATVSGTWTDADGNTGPFAFTGASNGGAPRPAPTTSALILPGQLAPAVFGGTGSATTVARSDHAHDDRYFTEAETTNTRLAAGATGAFIGTGLSFTAEGVIPSSSDNFTTDRPGRLFLSRSIAPDVSCTAGIAYVYLQIDGVPVRSTATRATATPTRYTLTGLTETSIAAGPHAFSYAAECTGAGTVNSMVIDLAGQLSVIVLP